ncbi:HmuY family protein [Algibacter miyuki]|uniref:HmuY family protein n=1 Tax=Algibacter miyuki TaxID=1306933 RepID=A0ABV5GV84_9FLAO|nr:HmuY family protein [Algibacter miyuki]MDN3664871.1 HmuY family protein [Algibacter miyuki]MDN3667692.1 HmuY family protein [Algibacter miyuki]
MLNKLITLILCISIFSITSCSEDDGPTELIKVVIDGAALAPNTGGSNEQNQVYIDLSTSTSTAVQRDSWDLGFYSGSEFRVALNGSIYMTAAKLSVTDIDAVNSTDTEVLDFQTKAVVGSAGSQIYIDAPNGDITETAISEISDTDENNPVYLINLGDEVGTEPASTGSVAISGDARGWKKIRILKSGDNYILQYADLDATTHKEVTLSKNTEFNYTFFSFNTENVVSVEPKKENWDLNFTVFTNEIVGYGAYGFSDFVVNNTKADVQVYMVDTEIETTLNYTDFTLADVDASNFSTDQRGIGNSWRNSGGPSTLPSLKTNMFYVINDTDGNLYKLQLIALTNTDGERGHPEFIYSLLVE